MAKKNESEVDPWDTLTAREKEACYIMMEGWKREDLAKQMGVAIKTFDHHRLQALTKLDLRTPVDLLWYCLENGIINLDGKVLR